MKNTDFNPAYFHLPICIHPSQQWLKTQNKKLTIVQLYLSQLSAIYASIQSKTQDFAVANNSKLYYIQISILFSILYNLTEMKNIITLSQYLQNSDLINAEGRNSHINKDHFINLLMLCRRKLTQGVILDVENILKQIQILLDNSNLQLTISSQLQAEIEIMYIQFCVKTRSSYKKIQHIKKLKEIICLLSEGQKESAIYKVNCMILYDMDFEGFEKFLQHQDRLAVLLYKSGNFNKSIQILSKMLKSKLTQYNTMRKVWMGRVLMESYDLSAFSWLYQVINDGENDQSQYRTSTHKKNIENKKNHSRQTRQTLNKIQIQNKITAGIIQKYEAKLLFTSGFKVLCQMKGKDPQITGVRGLQQKTIKYTKDIQNMRQIRKQISEFQKLKLISEQCSQDYMLKNTLETLQLLDKINFFPKGSLVQLDLRIKLSGLLLKSKLYKQSRKQVDRCQAIASQLNILSGQRKQKLSKIEKNPRISSDEFTKNKSEDQVSSEQQIDHILKKVQKFSVDENTKLSKRSKHSKISYQNQNHIVFKQKNKSAQFKIQKNQNEDSIMRISQSEEEDEDQKQNRKQKSNHPKKLRRNNYQFQRRIHPLNDGKKQGNQAQPNCCLLF